MTGELWVDYKAVKAAVRIDQVLARYGLLDGFKRQGDRLSGKCPVHKGTNNRQFSADVKKGAWKCFSGHCGKSGNVIDLVAAIEGVEFRAAALLLQEWFGINSEKPERQDADQLKRRVEDKPAGESVQAPPKETLTNKPLSFQLKLDSSHPYLSERGLTPETVAHFGLGLSDRGSMKGRIAIPIHNDAGELVAYAGRWVGIDAEIPEGEGKYKLPANFHKSVVVYNLNRIPRWDAKRVEEVILVEGYFSVFWLYQHGWPNVISTMGSTLSAEQRKLLVDRFDRVRIFFDGDEAGRTAAARIGLDLAKLVFVRIVDCPEGFQPDRTPEDELKRLLA